jgi:hypothetical protein
MARDPYHITYADLIKTVDDRLSWMKRNYPSMVFIGKKKDTVAKHEIAVYERLAKMLKAHKKNLQLNLEELLTTQQK